MAVGPGPDASKNYIYIGDIGDNLGLYDHKIIYRFEEPVIQDGINESVIRDFDTIVFKLPYERQDSETLMVDPATRDVYVVTKRQDPVVVYRVPYSISENDTITAEKVATLPMTDIVSGNFSLDGSEILLKNIRNVYYWEKKRGMSIDSVFRMKPKILPYEKEPQGEAIAFAHDGSGYFTLSEKVKGEKSYLQFYKRKRVY
jgi:hypothetical protein